MIITLDTTPRKCGNIKTGAFYGGAEQKDGGTLCSAWLLGEMWMNARYPCIAVGEELPDRVQIEINPRLSLAVGMLMEHGVGVDRGTKPTGIAQWGLADHVGATYYKTPYSFWQEVKERGPNRRMTPANAKRWADKVPFPVLFSHKRMPVFKDQLQAEQFLVWAAAHTPHTDLIDQCVCDYADRTIVPDGIGVTESIVEWGKLLLEGVPGLVWKPTWKSEYFGMDSGSSTGKRHPGTAVLTVLDSIKRTTDIPEDLRPEYNRTLFMASWFTYVCQAVEDEAGFPDDLYFQGIVPGIMTTPAPQE